MQDNKQKRLATVILAAGKGTRMESDMAKVLHSICEKPLLHFPVSTARTIGSEKIVVVIGHQAEQIKEVMDDETLVYAYQEQQLGTAHAVMQSEDELRTFGGTILILCGDVPLLLPVTLKNLLACHRKGNAAVTVMTAIPPDASGYGRVVKDENGTVLRIVEERDATVEEKEISEINTGIYCVESAFIYDALAEIGNNNAQGEYYLTDIFEIANRHGHRAQAFTISDPLEAMGINTVAQLAEAEQIMKARGKPL